MVEYSVLERKGIITLNRPEKRNALNSEMVSELKSAFTKAIEDKECKVIILKSNGKVFCSGADLAYLKKLQSNTYEENLEDSNNLKELFVKIYQSPKPVIAQVQGHAIAGGCGLATVCDYIFTVPEAKLGYTEVRIGFIPAIVKYFLLRRIGEGRAKELLLSGGLITAKKAKKIGLINDIYKAKKLESSVLHFAEELCKNNSSEAMQLTKQMIHKIQDLPFDEAMNYASEMNAKARATSDCKKGIQSFLDKKELVW